METDGDPFFPFGLAVSGDKVLMCSLILSSMETLNETSNRAIESCFSWRCLKEKDVGCLGGHSLSIRTWAGRVSILNMALPYNDLRNNPALAKGISSGLWAPLVPSHMHTSA